MNNIKAGIEMDALVRTGLLLVLMVRFMPQGLIGEDSPVWNFLVRIWRKFVPKKKTRADLIAESAKGGR